MLRQCLFTKAELQTVEHPITEQSMTAEKHHAYISVDTDNNIHYNCSCNFGEDGDLLSTRPALTIGAAQLASPPAFTDGYVLPEKMPTYQYSPDWIVDHGTSGIATYLCFVFRRQLKYSPSDRRWYYWDGALWIHDAEEKFLTQYFARSIANWVENYLENLGNDEKIRKKAAVALRKSYCSAHAIETTLKLMKFALTDEKFEEKRLHRGFIAAKNVIVDLQTGKGRNYRYNDHITKKCDFAYDECSCETAEQCFQSDGKCNCQSAREMAWVNERIKEICGVHLEHDVWKNVETNQKMSPPRTALKNATECWVDDDGREYAEKPQAVSATHMRKHREKAFEQNGMANFWRFVWTVGYILSGYADRKLFIFGFGVQNNGKTLIWNAIMRVFKIYMTPMHPSMIYGKSREDDGPTPGTIHVVEKRGAVVVETKENAKLNDESIKMWAGNDVVVGRKMRSEMEDFKPNLVVMANTNIPPKWNILDLAILDRIWMLLYPMTFVRAEHRGDFDYELHERPRDDTHSAKFESEEYSHGLLNWGVRACRFYLNNKETCPTPEKVKEIMEMFQNANNPIPQYINASGAYSFDEESSVPFAEFFSHMKAYCKENNINCRFTQKSEFKKLVQRQDNNDCEHRLSIVDEGNAGERIRGIRQNIQIQHIAFAQ